jgi:protein-S-isoprenylcysteine O-methyltransferase Ste14
MNQNENQETPPGLALRVAVSIVVLFGGLIAAIIFAAFFAPSFSTFQKIAVILVVVLAIIAILGAMWTSWGMSQGAKRELP